MGLQPTGLAEPARDIRPAVAEPAARGLPPLLWGTLLIAALTALLFWQLR